MIAVELVRAGHHRARPDLTRRVAAAAHAAGRDRARPAGPTATCCASCRRCRCRDHLLTEGLDVLDDDLRGDPMTAELDGPAVVSAPTCRASWSSTWTRARRLGRRRPRPRPTARRSSSTTRPPAGRSPRSRRRPRPRRPRPSTPRPAALPGWAATRRRAPRSEVLRRAFELMVADTEQLAALIAVGERQVAGRRPRRGGLRRRVLPLVRRGGGPHRRRLRRLPGRRHPHRRDPPAGRRGGPRHAVELPGGDGAPARSPRRWRPAAPWC